MKACVMAGLLFTSSAQASYFQIDCSNGGSTTQWHQGHTDNKVVLTQRAIQENGEFSTRTQDFGLNEVEVRVQEETELDSSTENSCANGFGYVTWFRATYKKVSISKVDGTPFAVGTIGRTDSDHSVEAWLICEENGNSESVCAE